MLAAPLPPHLVDAMRLPPVLVLPTFERVEGLPQNVLVPRHSRVAKLLKYQVDPALLLDRAGHLAVSLSSALVHRPRAPVNTCPDRSAHWPGRSVDIRACQGNPHPQAVDSAWPQSR